MTGRSRRRLLSSEELELWTRVTRYDEPLARPAAASPAPGAPSHGVETSLSAPEPNAPPPIQSAPQQQPGKTAAAPKAKPAATPPPQPFDTRSAKRIARGRREIDARLDLHGMRQTDAHAALHRFILRCQAEGRRHVLIITGKGSVADGEDGRDFWQTSQRGVLRRLVPHWLSESSMRAAVVSFTESAAHHGGRGALYVTIRKSPRTHE